MTRPSPARVATAVACWALVCAVGLLTDLSPSVLALAALVGGAAVLVWTLLDLSGRVRTPQWSDHAEEVRARPAGDARLTRLYSTMRKAPGSPAAAQELAAVLTDVVEARLGPSGGLALPWPDAELDRLLHQPELLPTDPAALSALLDRIESL
jgi:hypothetical protein